MKVLIADDDPEVLQVLTIGLQVNGFEVYTAKDALRAFDEAKKQLPDAILLDINMPRGSGLDVLTLLKASPATQNIPVIVVTGMTDPELPEKAKTLGAAGFLAKPLDIKELCNALTALAPKPAADTPS